MGHAKYVARVGALAVTAVVVMTTAAPAPVSAATTALIMCGTTCPTPDAWFIDKVRDEYIAPTHKGQEIDYVPVTTPEEAWPIAGLLRLVALAVADPHLGRDRKSVV